MHELDQSGQLCGTTEELSRLARCSTAEFVAALTDIQNKRAGEVIQRNGSWTIANRRMKRESDTREKRRKAGSIGGSKTQEGREANPYQNRDNDIGSEEAKERVRGFAKGEGIGEKDADWFFFKCEGCGWTNSGQPIRDWKAVIRTWWRAGYFPSQRLSNGSNNGQRQFGSRPKEKAPIYPKMTESRQPTEEEINNAKRIANEETAKFKAQFGT